MHTSLQPNKIYMSLHFNRTIYLKGHPYHSFIYESQSHLLGIQGSFLASFTHFLKDRKAKSRWLTFMGTWPAVALTRSSNEFWLSKNQGRSSCPKREDIVLGRKGHGARVTTGLGFSFPFFSSQRPSSGFVKLPLKWRQLRSHWGILILCSDHWPFPWRFWFRRVGGRRSLCLMSIPRDSVIVGWQESFGKV